MKRKSILMIWFESVPAICDERIIAGFKLEKYRAQDDRRLVGFSVTRSNGRP